MPKDDIVMKETKKIRRSVPPIDPVDLAKTILRLSEPPPPHKEIPVDNLGETCDSDKKNTRSRELIAIKKTRPGIKKPPKSHRAS